MHTSSPRKPKRKMVKQDVKKLTEEKDKDVELQSNDEARPAVACADKGNEVERYLICS